MKSLGADKGSTQKPKSDHSWREDTGLTVDQPWFELGFPGRVSGSLPLSILRQTLPCFGLQ